jgi:DNA-binding transcriptional ArsR family regulator
VPITSSLIDKQEHIEQAARALKSISHPLRLKILCVIGDQEACVQEIVQAVGTSQSNISQHLAILREKGVLIARKESNRVYYRVGDARTLQLIGMMREVLAMINPHLISPPISILQAHPWLERRSSFRLIPRWTRCS